MKSFLFSSTPRSLDDLDQLSRAMNHLSKKLGEEKSKEVEQHPEEFFNSNKFWYYQAKAYQRAIPFTFLSTIAGVFAVGGYDNSAHILRNRKSLVFATGFIIYYASYKFFERRAGFRNEDWYAHNYAKYLIITRNVKIKN